MPPTFHKSSFDFEDGERVPEHIEDWPQEKDQEPDKFWLMGLDTFDYGEYVLAINIDDLATARMLYSARFRNLNRTQPNAGSIQDKTYIMHPGVPINIRD